MALDPDTRGQLQKTARLWVLSLVCASVGAYAVWRSNDLVVGVLAFLVALGVFGLPLWAYERARSRRDEQGPPAAGRGPAGRK
jgi:Flp pilus assembly protein TadB